MDKKGKRVKVVNCKYYKSCGNVWGGCKHPEAQDACLYWYLDDCAKSEKKYHTKRERMK